MHKRSIGRAQRHWIYDIRTEQARDGVEQRETGNYGIVLGRPTFRSGL